MDWNIFSHAFAGRENIFSLLPRVGRPARGRWGMTEGDQRFYLREIHPHWTTPRISKEKVAELLAANLVELSAEGGGMIRLTHAGSAEKTASRQRKSNSTLSLVRKPDHSARQRKNRQGPPRPLS
jgi:hypothetical protein